MSLYRYLYGTTPVSYTHLAVYKRQGLCDTCHMHPRFYKYIEDLELCGVGLSCEASVELLAEDMQSNQVIFTIEDDNGEFSPCLLYTS